MGQGRRKISSVLSQSLRKQKASVKNVNRELKRVTIAMGFAEDRWLSSRNQARQLFQNINPQRVAVELFSPYCGQNPRWYHRRLLYPRILHQGDLFHLIDPAYADCIPAAKRK